MSIPSTSNLGDSRIPTSRLNIIHWSEVFDDVVEQRDRLPPELENIVVLTEIHTTLYTMVKFQKPLVYKHPLDRDKLAEIKDGNLIRTSDNRDVIEWFNLCEKVGVDGLKPIMLDLEDDIVSKCKVVSEQSPPGDASMILDCSMQATGSTSFEDTVRDIELFNSTHLLPADVITEHSESE